MSTRPDIANALRLFRVYRERSSLHFNLLEIPFAGKDITLRLTPAQLATLDGAPTARKPRLSVTGDGYVLTIGKVPLVLERSQVQSIDSVLRSLFGTAGRLLP